MTETLRLAEYAERRVSLDEADARWLARRFPGRIVVRRDLDGLAFVVNPRQHVGVLTLPSGRRLEIRPKVPVASLLAMLAVAYRLETPFEPEAAGFAELDDLPDVLAAVFADLAEERIARGLHRAYVEREDNLSAVRGRIAIAGDLRENRVLRHRVWCRFAELTADVPENQVVRQAGWLLAGWARAPKLRLRLRRIDGLLSGVSATRLPAAAIDRFAYDRLTEPYRHLHRLCRLVLDGASLAESDGPVASRGFLLDMNRLFEGFVTESVRDRLPAGLALRGQATVFLDEAAAVAMRPDLLIERHGIPILVADCKYKRNDPGRYLHHDAYQVLAYCTALRLPVGVLVYPRHEAALDDAMAVRHAGIAIRQISIDLSGPPSAVRPAGGALARLFAASAT